MGLAPFDATWLWGTTDPFADRSRIAGGLEGEHILVPLLDPTVSTITDQVRVATTLARANGASLLVMNPLRLPERTPTEYCERVVDEDDRAILEWALGEVNASSPGVRRGFLQSRRLVSGILDHVSTHDVDTLVLPSKSSGGILRQNVAERIATQVECDVILVNGRPGFEEVPSILLPIAGGPHSGLAADLARVIAAEDDAWIDVLHVVEEDPSDRQREVAEEYVDAAHHRIARPDTTTTWILEAEDTAEAIIEQSRYYDLTVIGAPIAGRLHRFVYGSTNRTIRTDAQSVVLSARNHSDTDALVNE